MKFAAPRICTSAVRFCEASEAEGSEPQQQPTKKSKRDAVVSVEKSIRYLDSKGIEYAQLTVNLPIYAKSLIDAHL